MESINIEALEKLSMRPFKEVSKAKYWEMLEVLPPRAQATNGYLVGEPVMHIDGRPVYECYVTKDNKFYCIGLITLRSFEFYLTDKPYAGKVYALTGGKNDKAISNGYSWEESEVK